jgi:hypothetical protein
MTNNTHTLNLKILESSTRKRRGIEYEIDGNGCWNCTSHSLNCDGYPRIKINHLQRAIYRFVCEEKVGEIPKDMEVRHKCDNRLCINPDHLELGTHKENINDMISRKRFVVGSDHGKSKLTEEDIVKIIKDDRRYKEIAKDYGVANTTICEIKNGKRWKHVYDSVAASEKKVIE